MGCAAGLAELSSGIFRLGGRMRLISFSVENYRSITKAKRIDLGGSTVLVGPNNEGKSNLVRGLVLAIQVLADSTGFTAEGVILGGQRIVNSYSWERDFPVNLQVDKPDGETVFGLEFELDGVESADLRAVLGIDFEKFLSLHVIFGPSRPRVTVTKLPTAKKSLAKRIDTIASLIRDKVTVEYIPAIRTAESARKVVRSLLERELAVLETDPAYKSALRTIADLQRPFLEKLSQSVKQTIVKFLPAISSVRFDIEEAQRFQALRRSVSVIIDDGTPTELERKGDGVQSLAALALMRHSSETAASGRTLVIVIEEPESHLHPEAMHLLKAVLSELREKHQLVLTTHSPLFVERGCVSSNIIVSNATARPAADVAEVRKVLGVRASDNLQLAEVVLIVEGDEDRTALQAILAHRLTKLAECFASRKLAIETLDGGSNLSYKAALLKDALLCTCHAFLDCDSAGRAAASKAASQGILAVGDITYASALDLKGESEIEDLYDPASYRDLFLNTFGVDVSSSPKFKNARKKWSDRMGEVFRHAGKQWNESMKTAVKGLLASHAASHPGTIMDRHRDGAINSVIASLEIRCR